jgi:carbonic anhydrase
MRTLEHLLERNKKWATRIKESNPDFFLKLAKQQSPQYLWIGCSDSRVPATEIVDLLPGEIFVHRNIANLVMNNDINCQSVIQYAVENLHVKDIIVCGHYGCGGIKAAMEGTGTDVLRSWLKNIQDVYLKHRPVLDSIHDELTRYKRFCEINVIEQVWNVSQTNFVQNAWHNGQDLNIHGWIYDVSDGILNDLNTTVRNNGEAIAARERIG